MKLELKSVTRHEVVKINKATDNPPKFGQAR